MFKLKHNGVAVSEHTSEADAQLEAELREPFPMNAWSREENEGAALVSGFWRIEKE